MLWILFLSFYAYMTLLFAGLTARDILEDNPEEALHPGFMWGCLRVGAVWPYFLLRWIYVVFGGKL